MLSIGKIALGQHRYYEQQVARGGDDYYSGIGQGIDVGVNTRVGSVGHARSTVT